MFSDDRPRACAVANRDKSRTTILGDSGGYQIGIGTFPGTQHIKRETTADGVVRAWTECGNTMQIERMMSFYLGDGGLHAVARQIRHLVAHGHITAYGSEAITKRNTDALFDLARLIQTETYNLFDKYVSLLEDTFSDPLLSSNISS